MHDCCGLDLRTGSLIVLWLSVIWWINWILMDFILVFFFEFTGSIILLMLGVLAPIISLVAAIISGMGVYGVLSNEPEKLKMFTFISIVVILFRFVSAVAVTAWYSSVFDDEHELSGLPKEIQAILGILVFFYDVSLVVLSFIQWYFMNVVRSYYLQLKEGTHPETRGRITPLFLQQRTNSRIETGGLPS